MIRNLTFVIDLHFTLLYFTTSVETELILTLKNIKKTLTKVVLCGIFIEQTAIE